MVNFDHSLDFSEVVKTLTFLENEKKIVSDKHGQFKLAQEDQLLEGSFRANDKGFGFIHLEEEDEQDIFVAKGNTLFALDGDTVTVKIIKGANPWNGRGPEGIVTEVLEHKVTSLVGEFMPYSDVMVKKNWLLRLCEEPQQEVEELFSLHLRRRYSPPNGRYGKG